MASQNDEPVPERHRCRVCGREFASESELEHHVRDQGLIW